MALEYIEWQTTAVNESSAATPVKPKTP
jgi:hypothetical protein